MKYNDDMEWFEEDRTINENKVIFMIEDLLPSQEDIAMKQADGLEKWLKKNLEKIKENAVAEKLLNLKNTEWKAKEEKELSAEEMVNRMIIREIGILENKAEIYFDDSGMFDNHSIVINLDKMDDDDYAYFNVLLAG